MVQKNHNHTEIIDMYTKLPLFVLSKAKKGDLEQFTANEFKQEAL